MILDRSVTPGGDAGSQDYAYGHRRSKTFNDNVHGHIELHRAAVAIIDTPEFQRLRHLKQLGLTYYIYPGASHNRFEHSLGVAHLATEWGRMLIGSRGGPGDDGWNLRNFEPEDRRNLTILQLSGLCHDLGHGPFSHVFEKELLPKLFPGQPNIVNEWHHETMSNKIFDYITSGDSGNDIDLQDLAGLDRSGSELVKALMHGSSNPRKEHPSAPWLFDIVANKRSGIDVDKFDYLLRDSKMCHVPVQLDPNRLMRFSRLDRDKEEVIFKMTEYSNLALGLFQSRAEMHRRVYTHQKVKSIEFMVCDALALAQEPLGLREAVADGSDISLYLNLDDSLLQRLQSLKPHEYENSTAVEKAQQLLKQLARRQLYKYVQEVTVGVTERRRYQGLPTAEEIIGYQSSARFGVHLRPEDVIVCETHIDQGMKAENPMSAVKFFQTHDAAMGDVAFHMPQQQVSSMLGTVYQDKKVRVYSKETNKNYRMALKYAFEQWAEHKLNCQVPGTPWRQPRAAAAAAADVYGGSRSSWAASQYGNGTAAGAAIGAGGAGNGSYYPPRPVSREGSIGAAADADGSAGAPAARLFTEGSQGGLNGDLGSQEQQQQCQHQGSGGRSRKRSLTQDLTASQQQRLSQQQQQSQGSEQQQVAADGAEEPAVKHSRSNGTDGSSSGGAGGSGGRSWGARAAGNGSVLPNIAEEDGEGAAGVE